MLRAPCTEAAAATNANATIPISACLAAWLRGSWATIYSHADDFAWTGLEADRWLILLENAFLSASVRPVAYVSAVTPLVGNWILELGGLRTSLPSPAEFCPQPFNQNARLLCEAIKQTPMRFVMIVDDKLRLHKSVLYEPGARLPSPLDLVAIAESRRIASQERTNHPTVLTFSHCQ